MLHHVIIHVTMLLIVAFFILFAAQKADGFVSLLGNILGVWVVIVAVLHIVGLFMPGMMGMKSPGMMHDGMMHEHWVHGWGGKSDGAAPMPAPAAAPATPAPAQAAPAPKKP